MNAGSCSILFSPQDEHTELMDHMLTKMSGDGEQQRRVLPAQ